MIGSGRSVLLAQSCILIQNTVDGLLKPMAPLFILCLYPHYRGAKCGRWLVQEPRMLKTLALNRLSEIVPTRNIDHSISQAKVIALARYTATNTDHKAYSHIIKVTQHVCCHISRRSSAIFTIRQDCDNNVMSAYFA